MSRNRVISAVVSDAGGTANAKTLDQIIVSDDFITEESELQAIEDGQDVFISKTGSFRVESQATTYNDSTTIAADSRIYVDAAADTLTKARLTLNFSNSGSAILDQVYIQGDVKQVTGGITGIELMGKREDDSNPISYS